MPVKYKGVEYSDEQFQVLLDSGAIGSGQKNDLLNTDYLTQAAHGTWSDGTTQGLFTRPFSERGALSAIRYPEARIISRLWGGTTDIIATEYDILTGVDAGRGSNASTWCGEAPRAGYTRMGTVRAQFGEWRMQTDSVILQEIGGRLNRGDVDQTVINMPEAFPLMPDFLGGLVNGGGALNRALGLQAFAYGVHAARQFVRVLFHGMRSATGASAELGFKREFDGFDQLIKTGYQDIDSGLFMPAADSIIESLSNVNISAGSSDIVELIANIIYRLDSRADQNGFGMEWQGRMYMEPDLFHALTAIWPCSYLTDNCNANNASGERIVINDSLNVDMRDQMRTGKFLWVMGRQIPVETTRGIQRAEQGPGFTSGIYFVNDDVPGVERTNYLEGFNMGNDDVQQYLNGLPMNEIRITNGGFYLSTFNRTDGCLEYTFNAKPRLILRTPWLCARLTDVVYTLPGYSDGDRPGDAYYRGGGRYVSSGGYTVYGS